MTQQPDKIKPNKLPFSFWGNKSTEIHYIANNLPSKFEIFLDVCGGSGVVGRTLKPLYPNVTFIYNDSNKMTADAVLKLQNSPTVNGLIDELNELNFECKNTYDSITKGNEPISDAAKYFYLKATKFKGGLFTGSKSYNINGKKHIDNKFEILKKYKNSSDIVYNEDCFHLIFEYKKYDAVLIYIDPPYSGTSSGDYKSWPISKYKDLKNALEGSKAKWILHIEYHVKIHEIFKDYNHLKHPKTYKCNPQDSNRRKVVFYMYMNYTK